MLRRAKQALREQASEEDANFLGRYFKTGPGEYGEGDVFIGVRVPATQKIAKGFKDLSLPDTLELLCSAIHEERLLALIILKQRYRKASSDEQTEIYQLYLKHTEHVNNWDLVDSSAEHIVGTHLRERSRKPLYSLARSKSLWERRIAIMATFHFIRNQEFEDTLQIAELLIADPEDLIHKAVGWMLREIGKRDFAAEEAFLEKHYRSMPRTMLRYAIEKFPTDLRKQYLKGEIN